MNRQSEIGKKADQALECLEGIQKAEPAPYFYTRLKARLERDEKNVWELTGKFLARPAVAFAGLFLILGLNAFILFEKDDISSASSSYNTLQNEQLLEGENILTVANSYDYENLEP